MSSDLEKRERDAVDFARRAVLFDQAQKLEAAMFYYKEAAGALQEALLLGSNLPDIQTKISEYSSRAKHLERSRISAVFTVTKKDTHQLELERAEFLLHQAIDEDTGGNVDDALDLYAQAVELCLKITQVAPVEISTRVRKLAENALERAEHLKLSKPSTSRKDSGITLPALSSPSQCVPPKSPTLEKHIQASEGINTKSLQVAGTVSYTKEEIQVLKRTSEINGRQYVPFMLVDLKEKFFYSIPFSDSDGVLALAPKQKAAFKKWIRPGELFTEPKLIRLIDCFSIKQTVVSDCSFVASLAVSAQYEKNFRKQIITSIIYPQNKRGEPIYSPCGKYVVRLHINGVPRKVIIDDTLPLSTSGELLCSYSNNSGELWVSLLEKAYMKVMGGYDFPGSNSNIDLHSLTGWIPERIAIRPNDKEFDKDKVFRKIMDRFHKGDVLVTIATGELSEEEADRAGLVQTHAYAMLDIREVRGKRLFMLKNPWSHLRWKGNYSEQDKKHWTSEMRSALNFDNESAMMFDNGVFWIDYDSVCHFFDVIYLNWNPGLFKYTYCIHDMWNAGLGPVKDVFNIGENPQYALEVNAPSHTPVWVLLTRHIVDKEDFAQNKEYITIIVYKNEGKRVYYPFEPPPYLDGTRINSPHYLCKMLLTNAGVSRFTLVVSQYEKTTTIYYTLRVFSTAPFTLSKIRIPYKHKHEITNGMWKGVTAGGCGNHPLTHNNNPIYQVNVTGNGDDNHVLIDLKGPKEFQVGFEIVSVNVSNTSAPGYFTKKSSGPFRSGFVFLVMENVPSGVYNIIPSTFYPNQEGPFFLTIQASCPIKVVQLQ